MAKLSFDSLKEKSSIFKNKEVLSPHFIPENLLYRTNEIKQIMLAVVPSLEDKKPTNLFIYGKTGTGKTCTVKKVLEELNAQKNEKVKGIYENCRIYDSRYKVLQKCINSFQPDFAKTGYSFSVLYEKTLDWIEGAGDGIKGKHLIIVLDEIDTVRDLDRLIYTLTRINDDLSAGSVSMIGISNKVNFKHKLDARSISSLCERELVFQPYNAYQLKGILNQRVKEAFKEGVIGESGVNLAAAIAAQENGDARYALILLLRAGELAEKRKVKITDEIVEEARKLADEDKAFEVISTLPFQQQMVLYAISLLSKKGNKYKMLGGEEKENIFFSGEVYESYSKLVKRIGKSPVSARWYREYLNDLEVLGLITTVRSGKGIRGQTTLVKLAYEPKKVRKVIEKRILEPPSNDLY